MDDFFKKGKWQGDILVMFSLLQSIDSPINFKDWFEIDCLAGWRLPDMIAVFGELAESASSLSEKQHIAW